VSKDEMIAAVKRCAAEVGHVPTLEEVRKATGLNKYQIRAKFCTYVKLLKEAGLEIRGYGRTVEMETLFIDWAGIARKMGKVPTIAEYELASRYSIRPLWRRFGGWKKVIVGMRDYALRSELIPEWGDVVAMIEESLGRGRKSHSTFTLTSGSTSGPKILDDRPFCGPPLTGGPMVYAPINENGVLLLFGALARDLGFSILHVQTGFPDIEAMREVEPGRWQRVRIELEYLSRNFLGHKHTISGCDLIVCWENNWPECPLEVIELKKVVEDLKKCRGCGR